MEAEAATKISDGFRIRIPLKSDQREGRGSPAPSVTRPREAGGLLQKHWFIGNSLGENCCHLFFIGNYWFP